jgi:hypothetical protein
VPKDGSATDQSGSSQGRIGLGSESLANGKAKPDAEKSPKEVAAEEDRVPEAKVETKTEAGATSQQPPNQIVQFSKSDHPVLSGLGQKEMSRTTAPGMAQAPRRCRPSLTSSQRRRI